MAADQLHLILQAPVTALQAAAVELQWPQQCSRATVHLCLHASALKSGVRQYSEPYIVSADGHPPPPPEPQQLDKLQKQLQQLYFDSSQSPSHKVKDLAAALCSVHAYG